MTRARGSRLSIASTDSFLSIGSVGSVLSIGSIGSCGSIGSIGSIGSVLSVGSALSFGSALSWLSVGSLLSERSSWTVLGSSRRRMPPLAGAAAVWLLLGVLGRTGTGRARLRPVEAAPGQGPLGMTIQRAM